MIASHLTRALTTALLGIAEASPGNQIHIVDRKALDILGTVQPPGILGPGHHIATDSKGNIYIAQTAAGLQKLTFKGMAPVGR